MTGGGRWCCLALSTTKTPTPHHATFKDDDTPGASGDRKSSGGARASGGDAPPTSRHKYKRLRTEGTRTRHYALRSQHEKPFFNGNLCETFDPFAAYRGLPCLDVLLQALFTALPCLTWMFEYESSPLLPSSHAQAAAHSPGHADASQV